MAQDAISITVDARKLEMLIKRYKPEFRSAIRAIYNDGAIIVQRQMRLKTPKGVSSRGLRETIVYEVNSSGATIRPTKKYGGKWDATVVEKGRLPGKMPPYTREKNPDFVDWAEAKGIHPYVLARHIAKKGTRPTWFVRDTYKLTKPMVQKYANVKITELVAQLNKG